VTTSKAITELREKLKLSREDFGPLIGVSARTVYRLEDGQQPTTKALLKLAEVSRNAKLYAFADLFQATRDTNINARVKKVSTSNRARRIPVEELSFWHSWIESICGVVQGIREGLDNGLIRSESPAHLRGLLVEVIGMAERLRSDIHLYIAPPTRLSLNDAGIKKLLSQRGPFVNNETPATINDRNRKFWDSQTQPEAESRQAVPARKRSTKDAKKAR
jgi:transcriptional regulator with XRE-family HTH domain